jgi:hypothetical protein
MELQVPGCVTQVVATPKCAIPVFHALSSRSVELHALFCVVNSVAVRQLPLVW